MKKFFEFKFYEDEWERRTIRFYPKTTHVHGFDDDPPKTWDEVYKTYLSFAVLHFDKEASKVRAAYSARCDECSALDLLATTLIDGSFLSDPVTEIWALGYATQWILLPREEVSLITMYPMGCGSGYTMRIRNDNLRGFAAVINEYLDYSLAHSEGI